MMTDPTTATLARLESQVDWWHDQAEQVARDRVNLRYVLPVGLVVGAMAAYIKPLIGAGILAVSVVIWGMGLYMTTVRRSEFNEHLREAQAELRDVQARVRAERAESKP